MSTDEGFIRAIRENPTDNDLRLVYADWLEDRSDPRAEYLRAELELEAAPTVPSLQDRLWHAWTRVDPTWLAIFTQPQMMRANPSPYPAVWENFDLGEFRPGGGTYNTRPYDSIPPLPVDTFSGQFQWLAKASRDWLEIDPESNDHFHFCTVHNPIARQRLHDTAEALEKEGFHVPKPYLHFMTTSELVSAVGSVTACFFVVPVRPTPDPTGFGKRLTFYSDSQTVLFWDLYLHPSGGSCVLCRLPEESEPEDGPGAWFVAPSFEAFVCRIWLENQAWFVGHPNYCQRRGKTAPPVEGALRAYLEHYGFSPS